MSQPLNFYKADLREIRFQLFEQLRLQDMLGKAPFDGWGPDECKMVIDESYRFATDVAGPLNAVGDQQSCRLEDGVVRVPEGFADAWKKLYEAGWKQLGAPAEYDGQEAPRTLQAVVEEFLSGSNVSFSMYPGLGVAAGELIHEFGTDRQKELYARRMFQGEWAGTMCLTEPDAGSDVGAATSSATKNDDGTYSIKGVKIFISGGDQDITDNVVHLVLARIPGGPPGTKGLSLFIVPKYRVSDDGTIGESNDVNVGSIEHKMGIKGSSTCVLNFGDDDGCIGELVGGAEHKGIRQMFHMMNSARIAVGIQGLGLASTAYLNALEYARERKQGSSITEWKNPEAPRVPIIEHPNIRRMLLDMKARVEGIRALILKLAWHQDNVTRLGDDDEATYHKGQVDLLTPLVKAYGSDQGFRVCENAVQVYGGAGYTQDYPVEQYLRDAKIFSIYEGTNAIQALDLVGRKLGQADGRYLKEFFGDVGKFVADSGGHDEIGAAVGHLDEAQKALMSVAQSFVKWFFGGEMEQVPLAAERFLEMMSEVAVGYLLLKGARVACDAAGDVAEGHPDKAFYEGKKQVAIYFATEILSTVPGRAKVLEAGDRSPLDIPDEAFASI